jgi:MFS transporter, PAT family, beta-lactamase induction signal transducer AmpG
MVLPLAREAALDSGYQMPSLPNLLSTRKGRLTGFFCLYLSEGLPQGFTATAVALEFKRMGMTGEAIGTFAATIMLPWTWKWIMGPLVDNLHLKQFGRRKQWIVFTQLGMLLSLLAAIMLFPQMTTGADGKKVVTGLFLFSAVLLAHNIFAASQDVAIDALACTSLGEQERGVANGLMFAGAQVGAAIGGSGVLFLKGWLGFSNAALLAPLMLVCITTMVVLMIFEQSVPKHAGETDSGQAEPSHPTPISHSIRKILAYLSVVFRVFFLTRRGMLGLLLAVIPFGGMALSLTVSNVLTPTLGMNDNEIATLGLASSMVFTVCCMTGGFLSDRYGRKLTLAVFSLGTLLPTLWMGWRLHAEGWSYPSGASATGTWPRHEVLITAWWTASMVYSVFQGLMYGIRTAFYMDIVEPRIAATHFTACMALLNVVTIYSYWWQGKAVTPLAEGGWGYTYLHIFMLDAALGAAFLLVLPFVKPAPKTT